MSDRTEPGDTDRSAEEPTDAADAADAADATDEPDDTDGAEEGSERAKQERRLEERELGLDRRSEKLDSREQRLEEREEQLDTREAQLATRHDELEEWEESLETRADELDDREENVEEVEQELSERAMELNEDEETLHNYLEGQVDDLETNVQETVWSALDTYEQDRVGGRFGPAGDLIVGLAGLVLVVAGAGYAAGVTLEAGFVLPLDLLPNAAVAGVLVVVGLVVNLLTVTDRV